MAFDRDRQNAKHQMITDAQDLVDSEPSSVEPSTKSAEKTVRDEMGNLAAAEIPTVFEATGSEKKHWEFGPAVWILLGAFSFTLMGGMTNALGSRCDWRLVAQGRTILSCLTALLLAYAGGARLVWFRPRVLWLRSLSGTVSLMSTFYALTHLPVADVLTLTNTYPIWIVIFGFLIYGEPVELSVILALIPAVFGVILIQQPHLEGNSTAIATALGAACSTAIAMMGLNRLGSVDPRAVVVHFSGVAALIMIPVLLIGPPVDWSSLRDPLTLLLLTGVGITGTIGQIFLTKAYAKGVASRIAVIGMSQVAMGLVFDIGFRQKLPPVLSLVGMIFVVGPVVWLISQGKGRPKHGSRKPEVPADAEVLKKTGQLIPSSEEIMVPLGSHPNVIKLS
ncbi:MAG: hypothetical protein RJA81_1598 [Planctomycetota bacterium]|jgi:drug/metabolite transporter (DMT)-like permease